MDKPMPPQLIALTEGANVLLDKPILLLGRHQECDIQLNSRKISRRHCCIAQVDNYLIVRDLCSTNGIRINGDRCTEGRLKPGDELTIGNFQFKVQWDGHPEQELSPDSSAEPKAPALAILASIDEANPEVSCDMPVPLTEPKEGDEAGEEAPASSSSDDSDESDSRMQDQPPSFIVPEDLKLESKGESSESSASD